MSVARVLLLFWLLLNGVVSAAPLPASGTVEPIFTPGGDAEGAIVRALFAAQHSVRVQAYLLTSRSVAYGLIEARRRGVDVQVLADREMVEKGEHSLIPQLVANNIPVWLEVRYAIAHNKIIIIDGEDETATLITGSFNFTHSAQAHNAENLLILRGNPALVNAYRDNWQRHRLEAVPYAEIAVPPAQGFGPSRPPRGPSQSWGGPAIDLRVKKQ
jgi:phosphatidylserine/phosphatidylglycerophosphate/cardiolipin synthase-like enzyme